jgi:hypothetical protein
MYYVDRGMQGKYYRSYNAETDTWSLCGSDFAEAVTNMNKPSPEVVGFFPVGWSYDWSIISKVKLSLYQPMKATKKW